MTGRQATFLVALLLAVLPPVPSRLVLSRDDSVFHSETVRASSLGNVTVVSYGYHPGGEEPSWARKAFINEAGSWGGVSCSVELLTIIIGPKELRPGDRRWRGAVQLFNILDHQVAELQCMSAPTYGHPYPIPEPVIPRTLAIFCSNPEAARYKCPDLSANIKRAHFVLSSGDLAGYAATFEPRPVARRSQEEREREQRWRRISVLCVCPLPVMDAEMKAKLHLWVAYHRHMGLSVVLSVESTQNLDGMPVSLLEDDEVTIFAPGMLTAVCYYAHVGGKKRGKYRRHFDSDKTLTTTFMRFESRIARSADVSFVMDFDEFLYAPKAPGVWGLRASYNDTDWSERCKALLAFNKMETVAGLKRVVSGVLDEASDSRAAVVRPVLQSDPREVTRVPPDRVFRWPPTELAALVAQGRYIRDLVLTKFHCAVDEAGYGIQIELPRADVANENFSQSCMTDNMAAGRYSLFPCVEYMHVLQKGSAKKRNFKNKVLNMGQV